MACRSCQQRLLQVSRQTSWLCRESPSIVFATTMGRSAHAPGQQRRGFMAGTRIQKSIMPQFVKDVGANILRSTAEPYQVNRATENMYKACAKEATYSISETDRRKGTVPKTEDGEEIGVAKGSWHTDFDLPPTFSTWSHVTMLHLYLIHARLRNLEREAARLWQQQLADHFFYDAEERMDQIHGITSRAMRQTYLKDIFVQWRGVLAAYDEGLATDDATLASAVWRNVFKGREDVDLRSLAAIVSWMRLCAKMLDQMPDEALFFQATATFKWPARNELLVVDTPVRELEGLLAPAPKSPDQGGPKPTEKVAA